jgi:hypothetical protein
MLKKAHAGAAPTTGKPATMMDMHELFLPRKSPAGHPRFKEKSGRLSRFFFGRKKGLPGGVYSLSRTPASPVHPRAEHGESDSDPPVEKGFRTCLRLELRTRYGFCE